MGNAAAAGWVSGVTMANKTGACPAGLHHAAVSTIEQKPAQGVPAIIVTVFSTERPPV